MKYFRVKFGYGKDDFISVTEKELPAAIRAQIGGKIGVFAEGTVAGNNIMAVVPDYQRVMGWNRDYQLGGEDYAEIGAQTQREYGNLLEETKHQVNLELGAAPQKRLNG